MTVYVDDMNRKYGRLKLSHMVVDSEWELHEMADAIGVDHRWFQNDNSRSGPHYDVCMKMKAKAIELGAVQVSMRELSSMIKRRRETGSLK